MQTTLFAILALPVLGLAQSASSPTHTRCEGSDEFCVLTAGGFNGAAASYLVSNTEILALQTQAAAANPMTLAPSVLAAYTSYADAHSGVTGNDEIASYYQVLDSFALPASVYNALTSFEAVVASLNGSLPQQTGSGSGSSAQQTVSSHAAAAALAKPTDMALMAMAGVAAGVAGLAYGL